MVKQVSFVGDGRMGIIAGRQSEISFVAFYPCEEPHDLDESLPHQFETMDDLLRRSEVTLNFNNVKSIENVIHALTNAKKMLEDLVAFENENSCDHLPGGER